MKKLDLSIVIVTYNCSAFIEKMLDELELSLSNFLNYEVLILDNNSSDDTIVCLRKYDKHFDIFDSKLNYGFAKANNILIQKAKYENILLLNPDVFGFSSYFWNDLFKEWDRINPMFIKLLNKDGSFQDCVGEIVSFKRIFSRFNNIAYDKLSHITEVGMGIMAFMITSKSSFDEIGLISEDYYMYSEDMDWCYRAKLCGYRILYNPNLQLTHIGGASSSTIWRDKVTLQKKYYSERIFIRKYYNGIYKCVLLGMNYLKCGLCRMR